MKPRIWTLVLGCGLALTACKGEVGIFTDDPNFNVNANNANNRAPVNNMKAPDLFPDVECEGVACEDPVPSVTPRIVRLTHRQWENTVRDLLRLDSRPGLSTNFLGDTLSTSNFDRQAENLTVSEGLWNDYREAAETLANQVASDPASLDALLPPDAPTDLAGRSRAFVEHFGERAFRRPLTTAEVDRYVLLMDGAPTVFGTPANFPQAAELALRSFLQSPHFLYRVETSDAESDFIPLTGHERASRISYALWNTMPDQTLLDAAESGQLDTYEGVEAQVRRMLDDPRAEDVVLDFHAQLLGFSHFEEMQKATEVFPQFNENTPEAMEHELELYISDVVLASNGNYRDLMTSTHTFANDEIAAIYGVEAPNGSEFGRVELDPAQRKGLLTRSGFLALNATPYDPNPIHRGVFIDRRILCMILPPPPDDFSIPDGVMGNTNRERIHNATEECGGACHVNLINPPGFAFENYDAMGAWRTMDGEFPVDATGTLRFDLKDNEWQNADELITTIADSQQAHACYVTNWFEYLHGRLPGDGDAPLIARLAQVSVSGDANIKDILVGLVTSELFLVRAKGEAQ